MDENGGAKHDKADQIFSIGGVFCKTFLHKIAKTFCRSLQLHFVDNCKPGWQVPASHIKGHCRHCYILFTQNQPYSFWLVIFESVSLMLDSRSRLLTPGNRISSTWWVSLPISAVVIRWS